MMTSTQHNLPEHSNTLSLLMIYILLTGTLLAPFAKASDANQRFQYRMLFNPTPAQLKAEERGRVMIYDGLNNSVVERAIDQQFDRIEHMMFIRIHQVPLKKNGATPNKGEEDSSVDDDC